MQRYQVSSQLGDGTYGTVWKATSNKSGEVVAIKRLKRKFKTWSECVTLRELESLRSLSTHPHIIEVREVIRQDDSQLYFVFEYMPDGNLYDLMKRCSDNQAALEAGSKAMSAFCAGTTIAPVLPFAGEVMTHERIRSLVCQVLKGLAYMHSCGYVHRDIKPENLLIRGSIVKVADFGLARHVVPFSHYTSSSSNPNAAPLTDYVSTRWYRAPEVLLRSPRYGAAIDIFAVGCVMSELHTLKPLFPGTSELDQLCKIAVLLGSPSNNNWPEGLQLMRKSNLRLPGCIDVAAGENSLGDWMHQKSSLHLQRTRAHLQHVIPNSSPEGLNIILDMLRLDPKYRPSASEALKYPFFSDALKPIKSPTVSFVSKSLPPESSSKLCNASHATNYSTSALFGHPQFFVIPSPGISTEPTKTSANALAGRTQTTPFLEFEGKQSPTDMATFWNQGLTRQHNASTNLSYGIKIAGQQTYPLVDGNVRAAHSQNARSLTIEPLVCQQKGALLDASSSSWPRRNDFDGNSQPFNTPQDVSRHQESGLYSSALLGSLNSFSNIFPGALTETLVEHSDSPTTRMVSQARNHFSSRSRAENVYNNEANLDTNRSYGRARRAMYGNTSCDALQWAVGDATLGNAHGQFNRTVNLATTSAAPETSGFGRFKFR